MPAFTITIDEADLKRMRDLLTGIKGGSEKALIRALNKTVPGIATDAARSASARVNLTQKVIKKNFTQWLARSKDLFAGWKSSGRPIPIINYGARQVSTGVTIKVLKDSPRETLKHAFIAEMSSGHRGVFWRTSRDFQAPKRFPVGKKTTAAARLPRKYKLPINQIFGPKVEDTLGALAVFTDLTEKAQTRLHTNMEHETDYLLEQSNKQV